MLKHADIWRAIDRIAVKHGRTASGLALHSGLDATTFNKSKRINMEGRPRWPSTESISKILAATGDSLAEFIALMGQENTSISDQRVTAIGFAQAGLVATVWGPQVSIVSSAIAALLVGVVLLAVLPVRKLP